jgi:hypothetical protein
MATTTFPLNPQLTALAIAYSNPDESYIADAVFPRVAVAKKFSWLEYGLDQFYTVPNTMIGRKSEPREVDFTAISREAESVAHALVDYVPNEDIEVWNAMPKNPGASSPLQVATMGTVGLLRLARERRAAALAFNAATYLPTQQQTLVGTAQWSDYANSDPAKAIRLAGATMLVKPNKLIIGYDVFMQLCAHPKIVSAVFPISQLGNGSVNAQQLAGALGLKEVQVGEAYGNTAPEGAAPTNSRIWGKHAALVYSSSAAVMEKRPTFGFTGEFGAIQVQSWDEPKRGYKGVIGVKPVEHVIELVTAKHCGYYFQNAVA